MSRCYYKLVIVDTITNSSKLLKNNYNSYDDAVIEGNRIIKGLRIAGTIFSVLEVK